MSSDASDDSSTPGDPASVFGLLSDETRVAILRELAAATGPVPFAALQSRVGLSDSGRFNYHLGKLRGTFVEKTPDGYLLTPAGEDAVATAERVAPLAR